jgi:hypothetical protein
MRITFELTGNDMKLLKTIERIVPPVSDYPSPETTDLMLELMTNVMGVLGEKHGFIPDTVLPHIDGEPKIMAEPTIKLRG